jgi:NAD(P)-dependent dehydrogenase (short-subunit alcohol dehydrogenase family)
MDRLKNKVAIVTGAGTREVEDSELMGTGSATAILFAREGARVILADIDKKNAERTQATIHKEGGEAEIVIADVSKPEKCRIIIEAAVKHFGKLDILFSNVGTSGPGKVTEGNAWDIAWTAVFLASDESRWISGVVIPVDAGLFAATPLAVLDNLNEE